MMTPQSKHVLIVGGGLAGMACAAALESAGASVTLLEARKSLGGRAGSFEDPQTGELLDNCQHVLLGCCTNLIDFYRRIGADSLIRFHRQIHFRNETGRRYDLFEIPGLPAPFHLGPSLLGFGALTPGERWKLAEAMLHMMQLAADGRERLADVPFGDWLDEHSQPESLIRKFYDAVIISGLNEETRRSSAKYAIQIFQESLLANSAGYVMGMPACSLGELYQSLTPSPCTQGEGRGEGAALGMREEVTLSPTLSLSTGRGSQVRLSTRVAELRFDRDRLAGVELQTGEILAADAYVLATNHHAVQKWIPPEIASGDSRFASLDRFDSVPILGVHLWFDRPILRESHAALMSGPLQWVFRKDAQGTALHGVISAARQFVDQPRDQMLATFEKQVRATFPEAQGATLKRGVIVIEKRATFSPTPGIDRIRPGQSPPPGGIRNLFLAGDYTQTGWPATMEGAVRSGYLAADAVVRQLAPGAEHASFLVDDLPVQWTARLMGYRR